MLRYTISYLANNDQFEEIKNIVKSIPMTTQQERKLANETLNRISVNYKERDKWSDFKSTLIPIRVERSKKIKESFILSWSDFSLLK
jgi:hypothetical protein